MPFTNKLFLVIDVGGTSIKCAVMTGAGELNSKAVFPTPPNYVEFIRLLQSRIALNSVHAVQISLPGIYDKEKDYMVFISNIPYLQGKKIIQDLHSPHPVFIENDANMAALGEYMQVFEGKPQSLVFLTLGTGVGGGVIHNGELLTGNINYAELGHITLVAEGRTCSCGKRGCVEKYCSSSAILTDYAEGSGETADSVRLVAGKAADGDFAAYAAFEMFAMHLAHTISSIINIFCPAHVRIGGGLCELAELYYPTMQTILNDITFSAFKKRTEVNISTLKNDAAFYGGLEWAKRKLAGIN